MINVNLSDFEIKAARALAETRGKDNKRSGVVDKLQSGIEATFEGCCAEFAVAKALNVYPDLQSGDFKAGDVRAFGGSVDVKWNNGGGYMNCPRWKREPGKRCDYYIAVSGKPPKMTVLGWATDRELFRDENINDVGNGDYYRIGVDNLHWFNKWIGGSNGR